MYPFTQSQGVVKGTLLTGRIPGHAKLNVHHKHPVFAELSSLGVFRLAAAHCHTQIVGRKSAWSFSAQHRSAQVDTYKDTLSQHAKTTKGQSSNPTRSCSELELLTTLICHPAARRNLIPSFSQPWAPHCRADFLRVRLPVGRWGAKLVFWIPSLLEITSHPSSVVDLGTWSLLHILYILYPVVN